MFSHNNLYFVIFSLEWYVFKKSVEVNIERIVDGLKPCRRRLWLYKVMSSAAASLLYQTITLGHGCFAIFSGNIVAIG